MFTVDLDVPRNDHTPAAACPKSVKLIVRKVGWTTKEVSEMLVHRNFDETVRQRGARREDYWGKYRRGTWFGEEGGFAGRDLGGGWSFIERGR